jgi:glutathione S-transferase
MKLYYAPFACSLAVHIALREAGLPFEVEAVDLRSKKTSSGADYLGINPKGYVPALQIEPGVLLTEAHALLQYVADQRPDTNLAPRNGSLERYRLQEMLAYIGTEIHKAFSPLWNPQIAPEARAANVAAITRRLGLLEEALGRQSFLLGETFSVADAYLFTVLNWAPILKFDLSAFPAIGAFVQRVGARPAVKAALGAESAASAK